MMATESTVRTSFLFNASNGCRVVRELLFDGLVSGVATMMVGSEAVFGSGERHSTRVRIVMVTAEAHSLTQH